MNGVDMNLIFDQYGIAQHTVPFVGGDELLDQIALPHSVTSGVWDSELGLPTLSA